VTRVVPTRRDGDLVITLTAEGVTVREHGRRRTYGPIPYGKLLLDGARMYVEAEKRAKAEARKARRAARGGR
jgi:hypothetical protein